MKNERKWKVLSSEYLFRRPWLTVRRDEVQLPDGRVNPEYYVLEYPEWINVIAINRAGEFVFVRQYRHGLGDYFDELCAGVRDPEDDSPLTAARRELLEETGYGNGDWQHYMTICANPGSQNNLSYCFLATDVEPVAAQHLDATEDIEVRHFSYEEVRRMLAEDRIKQALHAAPLWKYMAEHPETK